MKGWLLDEWGIAGLSDNKRQLHQRLFHSECLLFTQIPTSISLRDTPVHLLPHTTFLLQFTLLLCLCDQRWLLKLKAFIFVSPQIFWVVTPWIVVVSLSCEAVWCILWGLLNRSNYLGIKSVRVHSLYFPGHGINHKVITDRFLPGRCMHNAARPKHCMSCDQWKGEAWHTQQFVVEILWVLYSLLLWSWSRSIHYFRWPLFVSRVKK